MGGEGSGVLNLMAGRRARRAWSTGFCRRGGSGLLASVGGEGLDYLFCRRGGFGLLGSKRDEFGERE